MDYCPENCRWVSKAFNLGHQRKTRFIEVCSVKLNVTTWCKEVGLSKTKAYQLLHIGEDAFREEVKKRIVEGKGQQYFINKFCGELAVS